MKRHLWDVLVRALIFGAMWWTDGSWIYALIFVFAIEVISRGWHKPRHVATAVLGEAALADLDERRAQKGALWYWSQIVLSLPAIMWGALRKTLPRSRSRGA